MPDLTFHPMNILRTVPAFTALLGTALAAAPSLPSALSLEEAFALARAGSPILAQAGAGLDQARGQLAEARAAIMPSIDASAGYSVTDRDRLDGSGGGTTNNQAWSADVTSTWAVYTGGRAQAEYAARRRQVDSATARALAAENDILLEVGEAYFAGLLASRSIEVREETLRVLEEQLTLAKRRFEAGTGPSFDVLRAEVALANARPPLVRARNAYRIAIDRLRTAMGAVAAPGQDLAQVRLTSGWPSPSAPDSLTGAISRALSARPELLAAERDLEAARDRVTLASGQRRPTVAVSAGYGIFSQRGSADLSETVDGWTAGVKVSVPLFDAGAISGRKQTAQASVRGFEAGLDLIRLNLEGEVRRAWYGFEESAEIFATADLVVRQAEESLRLANNRFQAGAATQLDVLQAQLELTTARTEEVTARHDLNVAALRLRRAIGAPVAP